jgi:hypothetical protein
MHSFCTILTLLTDFKKCKHFYAQFLYNLNLPCDSDWRNIKFGSKFDIMVKHWTWKLQSMDFF